MSHHPTKVSAAVDDGLVISALQQQIPQPHTDDFSKKELNDMSIEHLQNLLEGAKNGVITQDDSEAARKMKHVIERTKKNIDTEEQRFDLCAPSCNSLTKDTGHNFNEGRLPLDDPHSSKQLHSPKAPRYPQRNPTQCNLGSNGSSKASSHASDDSEEIDSHFRNCELDDQIDTSPTPSDSGKDAAEKANFSGVRCGSKASGDPSRRLNHDQRERDVRYARDSQYFPNFDKSEMIHFPHQRDNEYGGSDYRHGGSPIFISGPSGSQSDPQQYETAIDKEEKLAKKKQGRRAKLVSSWKYTAGKRQPESASCREARERYTKALEEATKGDKGEVDLDMLSSIMNNQDHEFKSVDSMINRSIKISRKSDSELIKQDNRRRSRNANSAGGRKGRFSDSDTEGINHGLDLSSRKERNEPEIDTSKFSFDYQYSAEEVPVVPVSVISKEMLQRSISGSSHSSNDKGCEKPIPDGYADEDPDVDGIHETIAASPALESNKRKKKKKNSKHKNLSEYVNDTSESISSTHGISAAMSEPYQESTIKIDLTFGPHSPAVTGESIGHQSDFQVVTRKTTAKSSPPGKPYHNGYGRNCSNNMNNGKHRGPAYQQVRQAKANVAPPLDFPALRRRNSAGDIKKGVLDPTPSGHESSGDISDKDSVRSMPVSKQQNGKNKTTSAPATRLPTPGISYADIAKGSHNGSVHDAGRHGGKPADNLKPDVSCLEKISVNSSTAEPENSSQSDLLSSNKAIQSAVTLRDPNDPPPQTYIYSSTYSTGTDSQSFYPDIGDTNNIDTYETHQALLRTMKPAPPLAPRVGSVTYRRPESLNSIKEDRYIQQRNRNRQNFGRNEKQPRKPNQVSAHVEIDLIARRGASEEKLFNYEEVIAHMNRKFEEIRQLCLKGTPGYVYLSFKNDGIAE